MLIGRKSHSRRGGAACHCLVVALLLGALLSPGSAIASGPQRYTFDWNRQRQLGFGPQSEPAVTPKAVTVRGMSAVTEQSPPPAPVIEREEAREVTPSNARLRGEVNPEGSEVTDCHFEYGTTESFGTDIPCGSLPGSGEVSVARSVTAEGLQADTAYRFRLVATNAGGTTYGQSLTFETPPARPPVIGGERAPDITPSSAKLRGEVNPEGSEVTECQFELGETESYGTVLPCGSSPGDGESGEPVTVTAYGLQAATLYHFRVVAANEGGKTYGQDAKFETLPPAPIIDGITPSASLQEGGASVTITGAYFSNVWGVEFGQAPATSFQVNSSGSITATAPPGTGTVGVRVNTASGSGSASEEFTYVPPGPAPTIVKMSPRKGPAAGGTSVVITGTSFVGVTAVRFGGVAATAVTVSSASSLTAVAPAGTTGPVEVHVVTPNGQSGITSNDRFTFEAPTVTHVSPATGSRNGGTAVTVEGSGFSLGEGTAFSFGEAIPTNIQCQSTTVCSMTSPAVAKAGSVDVRARVAEETSKKTALDQYTYE